MEEGDLLAFDKEVFRAVTSRPDSRLECKTCGIKVPRDRVWLGRDGVVMGNPMWVGNPHLRPHGWDCSDCERAFTTSFGLDRHRRAAHR